MHRPFLARKPLRRDALEARPFLLRLARQASFDRAIADRSAKLMLDSSMNGGRVHRLVCPRQDLVDRLWRVADSAGGDRLDQWRRERVCEYSASELVELF